MIQVTHLDGTIFMLNSEWIQSIENTPDTLITLTTGFQIMVREPVEDVVRKFLDYKRSNLMNRFLSEPERNQS